MTFVGSRIMVLSGLLIGSVAAPAAGLGLHEGEQPVAVQADGDAVAADMKAMAAAKGLSPQEATVRRQLTDQVGDLQQRLLADPESARSFAGAAVGDDGVATVYLKGEADDRIRSVLAVSGLGVEVVEGLPFSMAELQERSVETHRQLERAGFTNLMTTYDMATGEVEAVVSTIGYKGGVALGTKGELQAASVVGALSAELRTGLDLVVTDEPIGRDLAHAAVGGMEALDGGVFECTIGWAVREVASPYRTGVTSAGHCNGLDGARELPSYGTVSLSHIREHRGFWGDVELKTTTGAESAQFIADQNDNVRNVTSVEPAGNLVVGESICVFGQSSNSRDCSQDVYRVSVSCTVSGVTNWNLVQMDSSATTIGGDSGGGWSFNNRAYGSVKGVCGGLNVFSFADYYDEAIGVRVMTT